MKRFLLPIVAVVLTSACSMLEQANDLLFSKKAAPEENQVVVKQVIVQPVMLRTVNMARQMQSDIPVSNQFLSPYTYPYRKVVYPQTQRRTK
mgnify:CR=1 FL=1